MFDKLDIQVTLLEKHGPVMALVLLTIDEVLIIRSIRVIKKRDKFFVAMPCYKTNGNTKNYVYCRNKTLQQELEAQILKKFQEVYTDSKEQKKMCEGKWGK